MSTPNEIVVATERDGTEAIYLNGVLHSAGETVYACDIDEVAGGQPILFRHIAVTFPDCITEFPESLEECRKHESKAP